ncbi:TonB-dependent receptor [Sphingobium lactosutens]|uniref:TonB-dependent receptor n=1 Tax=Sphingobium lactosutens TaxID=522773 RepID=UPI0015BC35F7|nr:TonB-dependent receptor [Sphingobium lactosutens]
MKAIYHFGSVVAIAFALSAGTAQAQQTGAAPVAAEPQQNAGAGLADIVVTAQRRSETAQSTPLAITAIGGETLKSAGVFQASDLAQSVPNLQIAAPFGKAQPNFALRGISIANEYNANTASPIGVYIDDAYMSSRSSHGIQLYDLERVEVLRGPQGTLYGRNTTAGAINFITKRPDLTRNDGFVEMGYGNENRISASGAASLVVVPDKLAIRGAFDIVHSDGYVKNIFPGQPDASSEDSKAGRLSLLWKPDDSFTLFLKGYYGRSNPYAGAIHSIGIGPGGVNPVTGYNRSNLGFYEIDSFHIGHYTTEAKGVLLTLSKELSDALTLSTLTSYDKGFRDNDQEGTHSPVDALDVVYRDRFQQFNQEVRVNYDHDGLKAILGGYYGWDRVNVFNTFTFFQFLKSAVPFNFPNSGFGVDTRFSQTRRSKAVFGQVDYDLTDKLTASIGLRYTWDTLRYYKGNANILDYDGNPVLNSVGNPADSFDPVNAPGIGPYNPTSYLAKGQDNKALSGRAALNYQFTPQILGYISYSRGYRAGSVNGGGYLGNQLVTLVAPEKVDAYEAGLKSELFDRRVRFNLAGFYYKYKNQQLQEVLGAVAVLRNAPKSSLYGVEAEVTAVLGDRLTANASLGYLHTRYDDLTLSGVNLDGNQLPFAPNFTFNGGFDWTVADFGTGRIKVSPNAAYIGRQWFSPFNGGPSSTTDTIGNARQQQKGYWLIGGNVGLTLDNGLYVTAWAKNIANKKYYVYGLDLRSSFGMDYLALGAPRSYGLTVGMRF